MMRTGGKVYCKTALYIILGYSCAEGGVIICYPRLIKHLYYYGEIVQIAWHGVSKSRYDTRTRCNLTL